MEKGHATEVLGREERKKFEKEADDRSIELVFQGVDGINNKTLESGILLGLISMFFFKNNVSGGKNHPDNDYRISNYQDKLNPTENSQLWGLAAVALRLWDEQFKLCLNYV